MQRAYSTFEIKAFEDVGEKRKFTGIASTISTDRSEDIVIPRGAQFKLPLPLLWQHNSREPIGWVTAARITEKSIEVDCEVHKESEPGKLKDLLDFAWQSLKAKLVRGLSIGFNPIETSRIEGTYGMKFLAWEWLELSPVTIAANQDSSITTIKHIDTEQRAALSRKSRSIKLLSATNKNSQAVISSAKQADETVLPALGHKHPESAQEILPGASGTRLRKRAIQLIPRKKK